MKNRVILLFFSVLAVQVILAQDEDRVARFLKEFNNDTASYVQSIIAHKANYVGKPLDSLLRDLPQIVKYVNGNVHNNRFIYPSTTLYFVRGRILEKLQNKEFAQLITITWVIPLDKRELEKSGLPFKGYAGDWTPLAYNYYKNKIVADIITTRYNYVTSIFSF